jgi:DNA-binding LacI/PurR family transcriptional regulator
LKQDVFVVSPSPAECDAFTIPTSKEYTAAICFSDLIALAVLSEEGKRELEIVSFDNIRSKFMMPLSFRSITSSKTKMSQKAVEILINSIEDPSCKKQHVILPTEMVVS